MRRILDIALKDLAEVFADRRILLFYVAMPVLFTVFMGFAYRGTAGDQAQTVPVRLGWASEDVYGHAAVALRSMLERSGSVVLVDADPTTTGEMLRKGKLDGALVVPEGFSERLRMGETPNALRLTVDVATTEGLTLEQTLRREVGRFWSAAEIARLSSEADSSGAAFNDALDAALAALEGTEVDDAVRLEAAVADSAEWYGDSPYNQASPGITVQFSIMTLVASANVLLLERRSHTLARTLSTSLSRAQVLAGHGLGMLLLTFCQVALLVVFGQLALGVGYLRAPLATLVVSLALSLWVAGMGLLVGITSDSDSQVVLLSLLAMMVFSALGGIWFPLEIAGGAFAAVGHALPSGQAMLGYQNILIRGLGLGSVVMPALVITAWAFVFAALAWWRFRRQDLSF